MSKLDKIVEGYVSRNIGNRIPTKDDVIKAYKDGMLAVKKGSWQLEGVPARNKPIVGLFVTRETGFYVRMINPEDIGNLSDFVGWAYLSSLISAKAILSDWQKRNK